MVDALSFLSRYKRSAGWLYPIRRSGPSDYERGKGQLILFGKTRVVFDDFPTPYFLEFFPRYGVSNFILSFYSGYDEPPDAQGYVNVPPGEWFVDWNSQTGDVRTRVGPPGSETYPLGGDVVDAFILGSTIWGRTSTDYCLGWNPYTSTGEVVTLENYLVLRSDPAVVILS